MQDINDVSSPFFPNFYLIKFGLSQSIIPKWEGAVRSTGCVVSSRKNKLPTDGDEDSSEDSNEDESPTYSTPAE